MPKKATRKPRSSDPSFAHFFWFLDAVFFVRAPFVFCIVISLCRHIHVVLLFNQLPHGESKPLRPKKLAKTHGPLSKQAHLSSFALREDAELGRGGLQVAARADLCR